MGRKLIDEINRAAANQPTLWWLGHSGFALKYHSMVFYLDPCLTRPGSPASPGDVDHADLILCSHAHAGHMDGGTLAPMLGASPRAKVVLPKSACDHAQGLGISQDRMTTTDAGLRVEYFKTGDYIRVYSVPSAHPELNYTPIGGYPNLGYLIRCGGTTIYHAGDGAPYEDLAMRLRPYNVDVALLPVDGPGNFTVEQAAELAAGIEASWLVPMHAACFDAFLNHMLFHRPAQKFKIFETGECWELPPA